MFHWLFQLVLLVLVILLFIYWKRKSLNQGKYLLLILTLALDLTYCAISVSYYLLKSNNELSQYLMTNGSKPFNYYITMEGLEQMSIFPTGEIFLVIAILMGIIWLLVSSFKTPP